MTTELDPKRPNDWRMDAYFSGKPSLSDIAFLLTLVPSAKDAKPVTEQLEEQDWVTLSQRELEPIRAGRFFIHTSMHRHETPARAIAFRSTQGVRLEPVITIRPPAASVLSIV